MKGSQRAKQRRQATRSQRQRQWIVVGVVALVVVAGITAIIILSSGTQPQVTALASSPSSANLTEESIPIQGRDHIQPGTPHDPYNSDPPTSGPHYAGNMVPVPAGFYDETNAPVDELLVHAQEHGYVILWYDCSKAPNGDCNALKEAIKQVRDQTNSGFKFIAVPRANMPTMLALTSWGKLQRLDAFDVPQITAFYRRNEGQSPEPDGA